MKVEKPWGHYVDFLRTENCVVKQLVIYPNQRISLQSHELRDEHWVIVQGLQDELLIDGSIRYVAQGDSFIIPRKAKHRITNCNSRYNLVIIETQLGICKEEDIIRYSDDYGRVP